ncbi:MAG: hypothetical protein WCD46_12915 [Desulfobacterales bacterium]
MLVKIEAQGVGKGNALNLGVQILVSAGGATEPMAWWMTGLKMVCSWSAVLASK